MAAWCIHNQTTSVVVAERLEIADGFWSRFKGVMGRRDFDSGHGVLLVPCQSIHTFGVRFPLDLVFLDRRGRIVDVNRNIGPRRIVWPVRGAHAVLELPSGGADKLAVGEQLRVKVVEGDANTPSSLQFLTDAPAVNNFRDSPADPVSVWPMMLMIVLIGLVAYFNSLAGSFVFDDRSNIVENPAIRQVWPSLADLAKGRPVVTLTLAWNFAVSQLRPWSYHVVNFVIHLLAALTLFGIVRRTWAFARGDLDRLRTGAFIGMTVALLWLVQPLQTESVTYIIQRCESLMGLFYLLVIYCVVRRAESPAHVALWSAAAVTACALGMGTKEVMVTAPLMAMLFDRIYLGGTIRRNWRLYIGLCCTWLILFVPLAFTYEYKIAGFTLPGLTPRLYASAQPGAILHYLRLSIWPQPLCLDYVDWPLPHSGEELVFPWLIIGGLVIATLVALIVRPKLGFLGAWFFVILAPTSSIMPIADLVVEHRMYLSLAALIVLAVVTAHALVGDRLQFFTKCVLVGCVLFLYVGMTAVRNLDYRSEVAIWQATLDVRPDNPRARLNLGAALDAAGRPDEAVEQYTAILALSDSRVVRPFRTTAEYNLGIAKLRAGDLDGAMALFSAVLHNNPDHLGAANNLGLTYWAKRDFTRAATCFREATRLNPDAARSHFYLGLALHDMGNEKAAQQAFADGLRLEPNWPQMAANEAWRQATHPITARRCGLEAVFLARQASLTGGDEPEHFDALGAAYAESGKFPEAIVAAQRAAELADQTQRAELANKIRQRLASYQSNKPYHQAQP
jgi:tetratricopeptide (TPR) repeat protein/uncharacterized membrane protein (UPF0127 family)